MEIEGQAFFLYFAQSYPYIPLHASNKFHGKSNLGLYGDVVEEVDWSMGESVAGAEGKWTGKENAGDFHQRSRPVVSGEHGRSARAQGNGCRELRPSRS